MRSGRWLRVVVAVPALALVACGVSKASSGGGTPQKTGGGGGNPQPTPPRSPSDGGTSCVGVGETGCPSPACTDGQTQPCYTGPAGTQNVGPCRGGTQTCAGGQWGACSGEVTPGPEICSDGADHNCNGLAGCADTAACTGSPSCQQSGCPPCPTGTMTPGCVSPIIGGTGEGSILCPPHTFGHGAVGGVTTTTTTVNGMTCTCTVSTGECCPCTANDCGSGTCCAESVCAGNAACQGLVCSALPPSCNGMANADCDDYPEDCDMPCCPCRNCH